MQETISHMEVTSKYQTKHHSRAMDADEALELIYSDFLGVYTAARREEDGTIALQITSLICPYCGSVEQLRESGKITNKHLKLMEQWADPQLTMLDDIPKELVFLNTDIKEFKCPHCGFSSGRKDERTTISVIRRKKSILIRCEVHDLSKILSLPHMPEQAFLLRLPLYEQLEFHMGKGRGCVRILDSEENALRTQDITNSPGWLSKTVLAEWFNKLTELRRMIITEFQTASKETVPFSLYNITLEDLLFFTRFVGYELAFYDAIPYELDTRKFDDAFPCLQELHTKKSASAYLKSFPLAKFKSIRKQILDTPGLLFYLPQCELLLKVIGDLNFFEKVLAGESIFYVMQTLKRNSVLVEFLRDYGKEMGMADLCEKITESWFCVRKYGAHYCSLNSGLKFAEQNKWKQDENYIYAPDIFPYSTPRRCKPPKDASCVIDGFTFKSIDNTSIRRQVGRELQTYFLYECYDTSVVVAICCGEAAVAAIEVYRENIMQAYTFNNGCIRRIDGLESAIAKWAERNEIGFCADDFVEG